MPDIGLVVSDMIKPPNRDHVTVTVAGDGGYLPDRGRVCRGSS